VTTLIVERGGSRDCPGGTRRQVRGSNGRTSAPALNDQSPQQQRVEPLYGGPGHEVALDTTPLDWQLWRESTQIPEAGGADGQNPGSPVGGSVPRASELKASCPEASRKSSALTSAAVAPMRIRGLLSKVGSRRAAPGVTIRGTAACTALDAVLVAGRVGSPASSLHEFGPRSSAGERLPCKQGVPGSIPGRSTIHALVAQLVERRFCKPRVGGSNPPEGLSKALTQARYSRSASGNGDTACGPAKAAPELRLSIDLPHPFTGRKDPELSSPMTAGPTPGTGASGPGGWLGAVETLRRQHPPQGRTPGLFFNLPASGHGARRVPDYPAACGEEI
jgi:hypothetical protein